MNLLLAKKKIIIIISAILTLISLVTGITTLLVSSQKQLNRLQQFPTQLNSIVVDSLQGIDSPYYKVFLISLDPGFFMDVDGTNKMEFTTLLMDISNYKTDKTKPVWTQDEKDAMDVGQNIWNGILHTLNNDHLTYGAHNGLNYFIQNLAHGMTVNKFLNSPTKQNQILDDVLKGLLTEMNLPLSYAQVKEVNQIAMNQGYPAPPQNIMLLTPEITGMKIGLIFIIIVTPIFLAITILIVLTYYFYENKNTINNRLNKLVNKTKSLKFKKTVKTKLSN